MEFDRSRLEQLLPPDHLIGAPGGDRSNFLDIGEFYINKFVSRKWLKPHFRVLDIGCAVGRMAIPLTQVLTTGSYEGFDIVKSNIDWCAESLTPQFPNFQFQHADLFSGYYNGGGQGSSAEYQFPYHDNEFDFAWALSVFTHMGEWSRLENYLREVRRVLKSHGRLFATFFFTESLGPSASISLPHEVEQGLQVLDRNNRDAISGFSLSTVCDLAKKLLFSEIMIEPGNWGLGKHVEQYQDSLLLAK